MKHRKRSLTLAAVAIMMGGILATTSALSRSSVSARSFTASGTDSGGTWNGSVITGTVAGSAKPGGPFTGTYSGKIHGNSTIGVETWTFKSGDTLSWAWESTELEHPVYVATYEVTGGTGKFAGATGSADYVWTGQGDGTAVFEMDGDISY